MLTDNTHTTHRTCHTIEYKCACVIEGSSLDTSGRTRVRVRVRKL